MNGATLIFIMITMSISNPLHSSKMEDKCDIFGGDFVIYLIFYLLFVFFRTILEGPIVLFRYLLLQIYFWSSKILQIWKTKNKVEGPKINLKYQNFYKKRTMGTSKILPKNAKNEEKEKINYKKFPQYVSHPPSILEEWSGLRYSFG